MVEVQKVEEKVESTGIDAIEKMHVSFWRLSPSPPPLLLFPFSPRISRCETPASLDSATQKLERKTHPSAEVARAEDVVDPPRHQQRLEACRQGGRPLRHVEVADAEDEHHLDGSGREKR